MLVLLNLSILRPGGRESFVVEGWTGSLNFIFHFRSDRSTKKATDDGTNHFLFI